MLSGQPSGFPAAKVAAGRLLPEAGEGGVEGGQGVSLALKLASKHKTDPTPSVTPRPTHAKPSLNPPQINPNQA